MEDSHDKPTTMADKLKAWQAAHRDRSMAKRQNGSNNQRRPNDDFSPFKLKAQNFIARSSPHLASPNSTLNGRSIEKRIDNLSPPSLLKRISKSIHNPNITRNIESPHQQSLFSKLSRQSCKPSVKAQTRRPFSPLKGRSKVPFSSPTPLSKSCIASPMSDSGYSATGDSITSKAVEYSFDTMSDLDDDDDDTVIRTRERKRSSSYNSHSSEKEEDEGNYIDTNNDLSFQSENITPDSMMIEQLQVDVEILQHRLWRQEQEIDSLSKSLRGKEDQEKEMKTRVCMAIEEVHAVTFLNSILEQKCADVEASTFKENMYLTEKIREHKKKHKGEMKRIIAEKNFIDQQSKVVYNDVTERMMQLQTMAMGRIEQLETELMEQRRINDSMASVLAEKNIKISLNKDNRDHRDQHHNHHQQSSSSPLAAINSTLSKTPVKKSTRRKSSLLSTACIEGGNSNVFKAADDELSEYNSDDTENISENMQLRVEYLDDGGAAAGASWESIL